MNKIKQFILRNKLLTGIIIFYFVFRLINLTKLPIFNDEAIYLDWGFKELKYPGQLFLSLYDAKQPLLMWVFGIFENIFSDPLFAGRFVSVITGFIGLIGIYKLSKLITNKNTALLACFLYVLIPIFSFYDRQALMESSIAAVGIWAILYLVYILQNPTRKNAFLFGLILGVGFFIKSSTIIFILTTILISFFYLLKTSNNRKLIILRLFQSFLVFIVINLLLFFQPQFWQTFSTNDRYSLTISQILQFPISIWKENIFGNIYIPFIFITPLLFICAIAGIVLLFKNKSKNQVIVAIWFVVSVILQTFIAKTTSQRYIVSFLPLMIIFAAVFFSYLYNLAKQKTVVLVFCSAIIPFLLTSEQLFFPDSYIYTFGKTYGSQLEYMQGYTSGIKLDEVMKFIKDSLKYGNITIAVAQNAGNPENALFAYFEKDEHIKVVYLDGRFISQLDKIDCLTNDNRLYFVSRGAYLTSLEKFLDKVTEFHLSNNTDYIAIWTLKNPCVGTTVKLNFASIN